jgi:beta-lactamase class A
MGREMTDLVTKVTPMVNGLTDLVPGVFLMDLDNSNFFSFNGTNTFSAASMIKLPILVAFFQDVDAGKIKLDEMLVIQQTDLAEGSGDMQYAGTGTQYTALETATNMIIISDNTATNMIIRRIGGIETINQRFRQWGMQQTLMRKPLPDLEGTNTTSPKELVSLLALLNEGKLLSMKSRDRLFDIMRRTTTDTLLPSVMSPGSTAAHKTGDIGSMVGDVGIIDLPSGRRYAIAAMVKRPHNDGRAQDLIRQLAAVAYEQFGGQPVITPSPVVTPSPQVNPQQPLAPTLPGVPPSPTQQQPAPVYPTAPPAATDPNAVAPAPVAPAPVEPAPVEPTEPEAPIPDATDPNAVEPTLEEATGEQSDEQPQDVSLLSPEGWGASR